MALMSRNAARRAEASSASHELRGGGEGCPFRLRYRCSAGLLWTQHWLVCTRECRAEQCPWGSGATYPLGKNIRRDMVGSHRVRWRTELLQCCGNRSNRGGGNWLWASRLCCLAMRQLTPQASVEGLQFPPPTNDRKFALGPVWTGRFLAPFSAFGGDNFAVIMKLFLEE